MFRKWDILKYYIEELLKYTHKYRMYYPNTLDTEFKTLFLTPCKLKNKNNILNSWLELIKNLSLINLVKILNTSKFNDIIKNETDFNNIKKIINNSEYKNTKIYNINLIKNKTVQWESKLSKKTIFNELKKNKLNIILPNKIEYTAPFVSHKCKL